MFSFLMVLLSALACGNGRELADSAVPRHYDLTVEPSLDSSTLTGYVNITVEVLDSPDHISMHARDLTMEEAKVFRSDQSEVSLVEVEIDAVSELVVIHFSAPLSPDVYHIAISFRGELGENREGFYRSQYVDDSGNERYFALTDLEFTYARRVFPCFDSPALPASFSVKIIRPDDYFSVSNGRRISQQVLEEGRTMDVFATTAAIPTYLVAFAVVDFDEVARERFTVYNYRRAHADYMLGLTERILDALGELHPGEEVGVVDQIVVPDHALRRNALESKGIVFYRESFVLLQEGKSTTAEKQSILETMSHALSKQRSTSTHPVTSWKDLWINEGITGFYQHEISAHVEPSWRLFEQSVAVNLHTSLERDCGENAGALSSSMNNEADIAPFDGPIFYIKSAFVTRMLVNYPDSEGAESSWSEQVGYPVVTVARNYDTNSFLLSQERFASDGSSQTWTIPLNFATEERPNFDDTEFTHVLETPTRHLDFSTNPDSWIIFNKQQMGYFRVNYDDDNWEMIARHLQSDDFESIHPLNRAQLMDDAFNLAEFGYVDYGIYLELIRYIDRESDFVPLYTFFKTTTRLKSLLSKSEAQEKFRNYTTNLLRNLYEDVGFNINPFESHTARLNRIQVLNWMCDFGSESCREEMFLLLSSYQNIHPDMEEAAYCGGMRDGRLMEFLFLSTQYTIYRKDRILKGMGCTSNAGVLNFYLPAITDDSPIFALDPGDKVKAFAAVYEGSDDGVDLSLDFVKDNFRKLAQSLTRAQISEMLLGLSGKLVTDEQGEKIDAIIDSLDEGDLRNFESVFEEVKANVGRNVKWRDAHLQAIDDWLDTSAVTPQSSSSTTTPSPPTSASPTTLPPAKNNTDDTGDGATMIKEDVETIWLCLSMIVCYQIF